MTCYYPIDGWRAKRLNENGKRPVVFNSKEGFADMPVTVPCGQCIGCKLERSRQWAIRCVHEATLYTYNSFITLTYNEDNLPTYGNLDKTHFQKFMKKLRKELAPEKIRYFMCGEYGEVCQQCKKHQTKCQCKKYKPSLGRPHYHAIIFNYEFPDKQLYTVKNGNNLYRSKQLDKIWGKGMCIIGDVTFESAAYVARYVVKKQSAKVAELITEDGMRHYEKVDEKTGQVICLQPEYITMSRGGQYGKGLAYAWYKRYAKETFKTDTIVLRGRTMQPPNYYLSQLEIDDPDKHQETINNRKRNTIKHKEDSTLNRLRDREKVKKAQVTSLKRNLGEQD